jgi:hypothetical protein
MPTLMYILPTIYPFPHYAFLCLPVFFPAFPACAISRFALTLPPAKEEKKILLPDHYFDEGRMNEHKLGRAPVA